jgi:pyruvate formate lyase activating enzyme
MTESTPIAAPSPDEERYIVEARFYEKRPNGLTKCLLCPRECLVEEGRRGHCGVRQNRGGRLVSLVHSRVCTARVDPIEKKPLYHYLPGSTAFSIATAGCNVNCKFCQNWQISQSGPEEIEANFLPPAAAATIARDCRSASIAYTYNEPTVFAEYMMDVADAAHGLGIGSIAISNGYASAQAVEIAFGKMDAVKIDLKAFSEEYYRSVVGARLQPVLDNLVALRAMGKWLEIVYLVVPRLNDSDQELRAMASWIHAHLGDEVPLHFSRFHPQYQLENLPATAVESVERAKAIAEAEGLRYVYIGNAPGHPAQNTYCPGCKSLLVERSQFNMTRMTIEEGRCPQCQRAIPGVWRA